MLTTYIKTWIYISFSTVFAVSVTPSKNTDVQTFEDDLVLYIEKFLNHYQMEDPKSMAIEKKVRNKEDKNIKSKQNKKKKIIAKNILSWDEEYRYSAEFFSVPWSYSGRY